MVDLKNLVRQPCSPLRALSELLLLSEPDTISSEAAVVKVGMYSRRLYRELARVRAGDFPRPEG